MTATELVKTAASIVSMLAALAKAHAYGRAWLRRRRYIAALRRLPRSPTHDRS